MLDGTSASPRPVSRRRFLLLIGLGAATVSVGAACQSPTPAPAKPAESKPAEAKPTAAPAAKTEAPKPAATTAPAAKTEAAKPAAAKPGATVEQIVLSQDIELRKLDPTSNQQGQSRNVYGHLFDALMHANPKGEPQPRVAESWEWRNDNMLLRLKIRQGIKFHNGDSLTADDVKYSLERNRDPKHNEGAATFASIEEVNVVDPTTVDIVLKDVDAAFLTRLVDTAFVLPSKYHQQAGEEFNVKPIGSGPYKLTRWVKDDRMELEANPDYWGGAVPVKKVVFRPIAEETTRVSALISGDTDLIMGVPSTQADLVKSSGAAELKIAPSPDIIYVGARPDHPMLKDVKVRVAINHAINRQALVDRLLGGYATVVGTPLIPGMLAYDPPIPPFPYDPARAKQLLAEAGQPNGFEVPFEIPIGRVPRARDVAQAVAADLSAIGIKANIQEFEIGAYLNKLFRREGQAIAGLWLYIVRAPAFDPHQMFGTSFLSTGAWNWAKYADPNLDKLIDEGLKTLDPAKRVPIYRQAAELAKESGYWTPLYAPQSLYGVKKTDRWSWEPRPDGVLSVWDDVKVG